MNDNNISIMGAIVLFALLTFTTNKAILNSTDRNLQIGYLNAAVCVTQSIINGIRSKSFDEKTISQTITDNSFSQTLGPDGESFSSFDDIDDYNGYVFSNVDTKYQGVFNSRVKVQYVNPSTFVVSSSPTKMKKITVSTFSKNLPDSIKMNFYSSY